MVSPGSARVAGGCGGGKVPSFFVQTRDPEQITETVSPIFPGSRIEAISGNEFTTSVRAWCLQRTGVLAIQMVEGRALLPGDRHYASLTVALAGTCLARDDLRTLAIQGDAAHFLEADEPTEFRPSRRSRILGVSLDASLLAAHEDRLVEARRGTGGESALLLPASPETDSLHRFLGWFFQELNQGDSTLLDVRIAAEVESVMAAMLAGALSSRDPLPPVPDDDSLRRAEEYLAASLSKPVSLAEVAAAARVSVRTLTRGFRNRHGVGPIGFLHRRRLEAARRELADAVPGEVTVTEVANRYCLPHTGRFAVAYRSLFGESPSETLRR